MNRTKKPTLPWTWTALPSLDKNWAPHAFPRLSARIRERQGLTQHEGASLPRPSFYLGLQSGLLALPLLLQTLDFWCLLLWQRAQWRLQVTSLLDGCFDPLKIWRSKSQKCHLGNDMVTLLTSQPLRLGGGSSDGINGMRDISPRFEKAIWHTILSAVALGRLSIFSWNHWIPVSVGT